MQRQGERDRGAGVYRAAGVDRQQLGGDGELPGRLDQQQAVVPRVREVADRRRRQRHVDHLPVERAATVLAARGRIDVIVRPLSTVENTSVASLFHCRQWSD